MIPAPELPSTYHRVGLNSYLRRPPPMPVAHRHNEMEFLYLLGGTTYYSFGGHRVKLPPRTLILFWSGVPHQVLESNHQALLCGLEIPLAWYLHWNLPAELNYHLLGGKILYETSPEFSESDAALTGHWREDINSSSTNRRRAVLLEIEARLWRFADSQKGGQSRSLATPAGVLEDIEVSRIERMARFIAENYTRPLHVREVAGVVNLHPNYAMKLFSKGFGSNFSGYLNQFRVAHAQRLLTLSDAKITETAKASGFGSLSRFNSNFRQITGLSPRAYRAGMGFPLSAP